MYSDTKNITQKKQLYISEYDDINRFVSYYHQIDLVKNLNPQQIMEIGIGNKTVSGYLRQHGFKVTTCDLDPRLKPNIVSDIRSLPVRNKKFDLVMACEILEHIPWKEVPLALQELNRISSAYVLISIPYSAIYMEWVFQYRIPLLKKHLKNLVLRIPYFFQKTQFTGEHFWEMGRKGYSKRAVRKLLRKYFIIKKEVSVILNPYHYFFVLHKKD